MKQQLENLASELETNLKINILSWWMEHTPDHKNGGFVGQVKLHNQVIENAAKGAILNTRILWTFSAAYDMFRDEKYLEYALKGISLDIAANDSTTASHIYLHISNAFIKSGFVDEAEKYINKSIEYDPGNLYSEFHQKPQVQST